MELAFDIRGNLVPQERIELTLDEFRATFVEAFEVDSTRHEIFENYLVFIQDFQKEISETFTHWINGSFVSNKPNPNDIDFVTLIEHEIYEEKRDKIDAKFRLKGAKQWYNVDAYTVELFPEGHSKYLICKSDLVYWDNWFSKTKPDWRKRKFPKGYIEMKFDI